MRAITGVVLGVGVLILQGCGIAVLYSAADGNMQPWAATQTVRFAVALLPMIGAALSRRTTVSRSCWRGTLTRYWAMPSFAASAPSSSAPALDFSPSSFVCWVRPESVASPTPSPPLGGPSWEAAERNSGWRISK